MKIFITYLATLLPLGILDAFWITLAAKDFYSRHLGSLFGKAVNFAPIAVFYPVYALAIMLLAVIPALAEQSFISAIWRGALLGLAAYSAYDLTNQATVANWPLIVTVVDICWGIVVTMLASGFAYLMINSFK